MSQREQRMYRSFEEFEREELRRMESVSASVDDMMESIFGEELDFEPAARRASWDDEE